jgi:hypothetical protein
MTQTSVRLVTFGLSLYCEKARWALDWHDIAYGEIGWPPGLHRLLATRCGAAEKATWADIAKGRDPPAERSLPKKISR